MNEAEAAAVVIAHSIRRRFDSLMGTELLVSPIVFEAARQVAEIIFTDDDWLDKLDEIERLEESLRE